MNHRRIIISTNIGESSITVKNVKYVIDFCLMKQISYNYYNGLEKLDLCWASKANII